MTFFCFGHAVLTQCIFFALQGSGLTIEQKMPRLAADMDADLSESHEGSASPNARKRKKVRRRSIETNNVGEYLWILECNAPTARDARWSGAAQQQCDNCDLELERRPSQSVARIPI